MDALIIGRQVRTDHGGRIDLLGLDSEGNTIVFELKRGRTPRDVVAQVLDYASWVRDLTYVQIENIAQAYLGESLSTKFREYFGMSLPENLNSEHSLVVVAPELDESSERIVKYLADDVGLAINVGFFNSFQVNGREALGRAWIRDPIEVEEQKDGRQRAPWSGYWFVNVGEGETRNWDDCRRYGFLSAGQGERYSRPLRKLREGDQVFAYMKGLGYVGYGVIASETVPIRKFSVGDRSLLNVKLEAENPGKNSDDPALSEWVVGVDWIKTVDRDDARSFRGVFANQNIVCKLRHPETVAFVEKEFGLSNAG